MFKVQTTVEITDKRISDLLCGALDSAVGWSYNWIEKLVCNKVETDNPPQYMYEWPLHGGYVEFKAEDDVPNKWYTLDKEAIQTGLTLMAEKHPNHFNDFVNENDDAITSDIFLQLCLFKEIVYG